MEFKSIFALQILVVGLFVAPAFAQGPTSAPYQVGVLPPEPRPVIPLGDDIILYVHGGPGSRLEEASDLAGSLIVDGLAKGKRYTVIAFDQPSQGYSSMIDPLAVVPARQGGSEQAPQQPQIPFPIIASRDDHFPGSGGYMHTDVTIAKNGDGSGKLTALTHTWEVTDLRGFRGCVAVAALDENNKLLWVSGTQNYGVDGRKVPFGHSDRTENWGDTIPAQVLSQARHLAIMQRWNPKSVAEDLNSWVRGIENIPNELGPIISNIATVTGVAPHDNGSDYYPMIQFNEDFIVAFLNQLDKIVPIKNRNVFVVGGSTGGALTLRMGHRPEPWIKKIVAWNPASVWTTYSHDALKASALATTFGRATAADNPSTGRRDFFDQVFGKPTPVTQPNPEEWYRGDRNRYPGNKPPLNGKFALEWPCKWDSIAAARLEMQEVYNETYARWHWWFGGDMLLFSFFNDNWSGPANTAPARSGKANYEGIRKATLLAAGDDDDWNEGPSLQWENRWTQTHAMASLMNNTPGYTLFLEDTGHSIHNERPQFFASQIVSFLSSATPATGPLQVRPPIAPSQMATESCRPQLPEFPRIPSQLLEDQAAATFLMQLAKPGGGFSDGSTDGKHSLRLTKELRAVAQRRDPAFALGAAAASFYKKEDPVLSNAYADLAVTGRNVYDAFRRHAPTDNEIAAHAAAVLKAGSWNNALTQRLDETELMNAVHKAQTRAYQVAWALRNPNPEAGYQFRRTLGWIAVSGEDDPPARPVNVPSGIPIYGPDHKQISAYPQYDLPVDVSGTRGNVVLQIRYTIASAPGPVLKGIAPVAGISSSSAPR